ncbi:methenyltetrahydromethanopterin cyclohydrolase [Cupriavidus sp. IK-TO18]|uniref:methenyltetrahydromethanopterin cyclohydrolase n=1 Tax=Cupriavidus sp. IK-TO18 TaxID=2782182 RepID=UPI0018985B0E|nr:methenyltetrahydromethanopterin cyclohydrolase [Cupriavidus sp. IK-TO18]MBF6989190.1 methenyltetrahydromethanopterin cyclohydrolase [Cupriavidus sp. IK-TO18]
MPSTTPATRNAGAAPSPSVNSLSQPLLARLLAQAGPWRLAVSAGPLGVRIVDAGVETRGSIAAGLAIAEICMGGLGRVQLRHGSDRSESGPDGGWPTRVEVSSGAPVLACLASQYAGWSLAASKEETGGKKFFALGSGPARALAGKEPLFAELGYRDRIADDANADANANGGACLVLEVDRAPPEAVVAKILRDCGLRPEQLTLILTPTASLAGTTQVVGRVLEVALHKAHVLGFALDRIVEGSAAAPLPPPGADAGEAMGRTNDAILYGGTVHLTVDTGDDAARALALALPSIGSRDYGRPFAEVFREYDHDFYRIDPALFAPAEVWVSNLASGRTWHAGALNMALLRGQWLQEA